MTKYCNDSSYGLNGFIDNLEILEPSDDAATIHLGNGSRTPTYTEWLELLENTTYGYTMQNGIYGCRFTASNGNTIFLPASGCRCDSYCYNSGEGEGARLFYMTANFFPSVPWMAVFWCDDCVVGDFYFWIQYTFDGLDHSRDLGFSVRAVCDR